MATLERLSIMGIRSFAPRDDQSLEFFNPLTLIVGQNGTGKTTIIECLRYITTGELPPMSRLDSAFIHDPKIAQVTEVKAQVRLGFTDTRGNHVVATRSVSATQKQKRVTMKSLDSTISRKGENGEVVQISSRCAEIDREMVTCFGVSKAILNNVIFCHQEDSNWPLCEGKALKMKFDDIFAATRYIKALDNIYNIKKEHDANAKLWSAELRYLEENKKHAAKLRSNLETLESRLAASKDQIQKIGERLQPIASRLTEIGAKEKSIVDIQTNLAKKETELQLEQKACDKLTKTVAEMFTGSMDDLLSRLRNMKSQSQEKEDERQEFEEQLEKIKKDIPNMTKKREVLLVDLSKLRTEAEQHKLRLKEREQLAKTLYNSHNLEIGWNEGQLTDSVADDVLRKLADVIKSKKQDYEKLKNRFAEKEKTFQDHLNTVRDAKTKLNQTVTIRKSQIVDSNKELELISEKLIRAEAAAERLQEIESKLQRKEKELYAVSGELDRNAAQTELQTLQRQASSLNDTVKQLDESMMRMHKFSAVQAELELTQTQKTSKEESIRKLKAKHQDTLMRLFNCIPTQNFSSHADQLNLKILKDKNALSDKRDTLRSKIAMLETARKSKIQEQKAKEAELADCEEKLFQSCGSKDLDSSIIAAESFLTNLQEENASLSGTEHVYTGFLKKLKQNDPCCPLCHRDFGEQQDINDLVTELETKLRLFPHEVEAKQKALKDQQQKYNSLLVLKPHEERVRILNEEDIPHLKTKIKALGLEIEKRNQELAEVEKDLSQKSQEESAVQDMRPDLRIIDQNESELAKIEKKLSNAKMSLGEGSNRTIEDISKEKHEVQHQLEELQQSIKNKQKSLNDFLERVQALQAEVNALGSEKNKITQDVQEIAQLQSRKSDLKSNISLYQVEIEENEKKLIPYEENLQLFEKEKEILISQKESEIDKSNQNIITIQSKVNELLQIHTAILRFSKSQKPEDLNRIQKDLEILNAKLDRLNLQQEDVTEKWRFVCQSLDRHQAHLRNLTDNRELKLKQEHMELIGQDVAELKHRLGGFNVSTLLKEKRNLLIDEQNSISEWNKAEGKQSEIEESIRKAKSDLRNDQFQGADEKYKKKLIEYKVTTIASEDLLKYYNALEGAIMQYHTLKMEEINKILRELWCNTYCGHDIDYIAIKTDDETQARATTRRRNYQYRVVMVKGGIEQDMRGRCSAGQRVLASLLIRLALAETFCLSCGVLALDEPTTNLDRDNIESLAKSLGQLVKSRSQYRHFQLIVITHDEDFVEQLGRSEFVDYYYRITKNDSGHSIIKLNTVREVNQKVE